jgi:hypothetical protein
MIAAQYPGVCSSDCGYPIRPGQLIEPDADELEGWRHVKCPTDPTAGLPVCPRCFCRHRGEC